MSKKFSVIVADCPWPFKDSLKMSDVPRGALANYDTMTISDIQSLPVKMACHPDGAVLCLWVPSSLLAEGLETMKAWGFKHKQTYIWVKTKNEPLMSLTKSIKHVLKDQLPILKTSLSPKVAKGKLLIEGLIDRCEGFITSNVLSFGMGRLFRQTHEICLIGTSNNKIYKSLKNKSQRSVSFAPNLKHSAKPEHLQDSLDIMFPGANKLELFARREKKGWTCLGNECPSSLGEDIAVSLSKL
jgi:N6-adenosine-specific RNA methylase IME4